jgi:hypothetical protein
VRTSFELGSSFKRTETSPRKHAAAPLSTVALARARKIISGSPVPEDIVRAQRSRPSAFDHFCIRDGPATAAAVVIFRV